MNKASYRLIDSGNFRRLDKLGPYYLIRPSLQAVWSPLAPQSEWKKADAEFIRGKHGDGSWKLYNKDLPNEWTISASNKLKMIIRLTDFGHLGIFPEHHQNTDLCDAIANHLKAKPSFKLLNLFAYTGAVSLLGASMGAEVTHVDASKTSVSWARDNGKMHSEELKIRWIIEDVKKFIAREVRRKSKYHGIVLDPPSFGRGTKGEVWKIEDDLVPLLNQIQELQDEQFSFLQLSAHSPGFTPLALHNLLKPVCPKNGEIIFSEMSVKAQTGNIELPSGARAVFKS
ncbi:MAG: class I SAM-dependent methyltransferase [Oligoflexales bacterium]